MMIYTHPAHIRSQHLGATYVRLAYIKDKDKDDKDLFIDPQEFVVGYSKAPEQPQSSARPICHSHTF